MSSSLPFLRGQRRTTRRSWRTWPSAVGRSSLLGQARLEGSEGLRLWGANTECLCEARECATGLRRSRYPAKVPWMRQRSSGPQDVPIGLEIVTTGSVGPRTGTRRRSWEPAAKLSNTSMLSLRTLVPRVPTTTRGLGALILVILSSGSLGGTEAWSMELGGKSRQRRRLRHDPGRDSGYGQYRQATCRDL